jgi:Ca2+-binding RTX toxin-like protein
VTRTRRFFAALVASCCALLAFASFASAQERLYGATGGPDPSNLYLLDPASGAVLQTVGPIGFSVTGLAVDPSTGTLYGTTSAQDATNPCSLITINKTAGAGTLVGDLGVCPPDDAAADITFTPDGTLFGWIENDLDDLGTIDKATGATSIVGDAGISTLGSGLASDSAGTLFFAGQTDSGPLRTVDRNTGATTQVALLDGTTIDPIGALAFNSAGTLFGVRIDNDLASRPTELITIDTASGAINVRGPSVDRLDAIVFETPRPPTPTPSAICKGNPATIVGTPGKDVLSGTDERDVIAGLGGNDSLSGVARNDLICGGKGNDKLKGGKGNDTLIGGANADRLFGGAGNDRLFGGTPGAPPRDAIDTCLGQGGADRVQNCEKGSG